MQLLLLILAIKSISGRHQWFFHIALNLMIPNVIDFMSVGVFFVILFIIDFLGEHLCCLKYLRFIHMFFVKKKNLRPNNTFRKSRS